MSFVQPQASQGRYSFGIGVAVVFHIALLWALMSGLGHKVVQAIKAPIETKVIVEQKPPPPPPKVIELPPPPNFTPPPPAFVPPPEVAVQTPPPPTAIAATVSEPPAVVAPPTPAAPPAPAPVAAMPVPVPASVVCSNYGKVMGDADFPREALRAGLEAGEILIEFTLSANGQIKDVKALRASHPSFAKGAMRIVAEYKCAGQGRDVQVQVPFVFNVK